MSLRIAVLTPIPTPYRDPFWQRLGDREDIALRVLFCAAGKADRPWTAAWGETLDAWLLPGRNLLGWRAADASCYWNPSYRRELEAFEPDALLVGGYNHLTMHAGMRWARRNGVPFFLMCETWRLRRGGPRAWLRDRVVRSVMERSAGVLTTGQRARRFVAHYAGTSKPCMDLPNVPDVEAIRSAAPVSSAAKGKARVIFVGRFIPKKRVGDLVAAFAELPPALRERAQLELVGDGDLRQELQVDVARRGLEDRVRFRGFLQPDEVLEAYRGADIFVMPSSETWGVAPIEAAASGLRVIVSDEVGCAEDLERFTPLGTFPFGDVPALRGCLEKQLTEVLMNKSLSCGDWTGWTYDALADTTASFLHESCRHSPPAHPSRT